MGQEVRNIMINFKVGLQLYSIRQMAEKDLF